MATKAEKLRAQLIGLAWVPQNAEEFNKWVEERATTEMVQGAMIGFNFAIEALAQQQDKIAGEV